MNKLLVMDVFLGLSALLIKWQQFES